MDAGKRTISDIFNGNRKLVIPFFQRAYVWRERQWSRLIEDMEYISKTGKDYFLIFDTSGTKNRAPRPL